MSAVTSSLILLLCLRVHASDARVLLGWNPNGIPGAFDLRRTAGSSQLMSSQKVEPFGGDNGLPTRSSSLSLSPYQEHPGEVGNGHHIQGASCAKSKNGKLVPSKRRISPRTDSPREGGLFSDYSRPRMRPPSHN
ncbi:hypothetical protein MLD38_033589 [Melastoma candidum]|uniref:Uncharacterized protein n=1 Tax=Melastoma candidum TaxID=119954 RepID=A0ACB9M8K0_9MYRT|nr:hypothetical protein MLD38_033589 [Melastoma candidum]